MNLPSHAGEIKALNARATGGISLSPAFATDTRDYRADVQSDISAVAFGVQTLKTDATVSLSVNGKAADAAAPMLARLSVGNNVVEMKVMDSSAKLLETYRIQVNREDIGPIAQKFLKKTFADSASDRNMPYRLFVPEGMDASKKYPLVVFLHGGGERGEDNEITLTANEGGTIWAKPQEQAKRAAFVLVPQARNAWDGGFGRTRNAENKLDLSKAFVPSDDLQTAHRLLTQVLKDYPSIDAKRLYITGISQGGLGTWAWNVLHPQLFAAMVPVCGGAEPAEVKVLKTKPLWAFHAASDPVLPVDMSRKAIQGVLSSGGYPQYTEYEASTYFFPNAHFSWVPAYQTVAMREWLFNQALR